MVVEGRGLLQMWHDVKLDRDLKHLSARVFAKQISVVQCMPLFGSC
jgi:hypothetical protein